MRSHVSEYQEHMLQNANTEQRAVAICKREQERWNEGTSEWLSAGNMVKDREQVFRFGPPQEWQLVLLEGVDSEEVIEVFDPELSEQMEELLMYNVADCARHRMSYDFDSLEDHAAGMVYSEKANEALSNHLKRTSKQRTYHCIEDIVLNKDGSLKAACKPKKETKREWRLRLQREKVAARKAKA